MIITLLRAILFFFVLIIALRLMGKRQIGEMQPGELVITILITECAAAPLQDLSRPVTNGIIAVFTLVILEVLLSYLTLKLPFLRRAVDGNPVIIVKDGKIDQKAMLKTRITLDELFAAFRQNEIFELSEVLYAIMETDGKISVMKSPSARSATADMVDKIPPDNGLPWIVINDGKITPIAVEICGAECSQVKKILKKEKTSLKDVFLLIIDRNGNYNLVKKER